MSITRSIKGSFQPVGKKNEHGHKPFVVFELNGVLCHTKHIPKVPMTSYRNPSNMDYDKVVNTLINWKIVWARPIL